MSEPARLRPTDEQHAINVQDRRIRRMDAVDGLPADMRELVHEYGLSVVTACRHSGVMKARHIRHIVETVLNEFSPTRGANSLQGPRRAEGVNPGDGE